MQVGIEPQRHPATPIARDRRPRPVGRQRDRLRQVGEGLGPIGELPGNEAVGIGLFAQHVVLP